MDVENERVLCHVIVRREGEYQNPDTIFITDDLDDISIEYDINGETVQLRGKEIEMYNRDLPPFKKVPRSQKKLIREVLAIINGRLDRRKSAFLRSDISRQSLVWSEELDQLSAEKREKVLSKMQVYFDGLIDAYKD